MDFVAIDFETANEKRNSPCSLGITVVSNNKIVEEKYYLIKPKEMRFSNMNIMIHGIREKDVENEREFNELWDEIKPYLHEKIIVAHNASFDISVLRRTLDTYEIEYPSFEYLCTMVAGRNFYKELENAKLNTINDFLGYEFNHHDAQADASACANVLLNILDEINGDTLEDIENNIGMKSGSLFERGYTPVRVKKGEFKTSNRKRAERKEIINMDKWDGGKEFFEGQTVVFTGPLMSMGRAEGMSIVRKLGATTGGTVTKKTSILIVGGKKPQLTCDGNSTSKMRKVWALKE
ncbi:MAG: exonuclease domain-containing protein, partial [Clostridium sp.]